MRIILGIMALSVLVSIRAAGEPLHFQSGVKQVSLLELYTSEGCSSCPPAEAWVNRLKESPELWRSFVPVAFHVDYWDNLGWKDHLSSPEYAERQRSYAQAWHAENIYTPEFIVNGSEWHNTFGLHSQPPSSGAAAGILEIISTNGSHWNVTFNQAMTTNGGYEVHAALLAGGLSSEVKAG